MKTYIFLIAILAANACNSTKGTKEVSEVNSEEKMEMIKDNCPEAGDCTLKVMKNKNMILKEDTTGMLYPVFEDGENMVVEFTYSEKGPEGTADGNYSETIHFEVPNSAESLKLANSSLQTVSLLYGKQCFCRGEAGFYKVKKGSFSLSKTGKQLNFEVNFKIDETSQKVTSIKRTVSL
ncbi:hypothetical protein [Ulvibacter antarcticus]|uniref:Uncharacterized protein n=1 Tax=Ulvibacter antarcticus TaxID=442714 RepID=A0A3L9YCS1_9FLAO|nr:hypothetical protein [Ulvibacter antarcticus]RMA57180.1 hypothetical protein BXY75_3067 [Ulvibacter antarcticus]